MPLLVALWLCTFRLFSLWSFSSRIILALFAPKSRHFRSTRTKGACSFGMCRQAQVVQPLLIELRILAEVYLYQPGPGMGGLPLRPQEACLFARKLGLSRRKEALKLGHLATTCARPGQRGEVSEHSLQRE